MVVARGRVSTARRLAESPAVKLLFVGDVVGGLGRRTLAALLPGLRDAPPARLRGRERRERRRRRGHHREDRPRAARHGRRRDHARQPRLPPPRGLRLPRPRGADRAAGQLPEGQPRTRPHRRGARRQAARGHQPLGPGLPQRRALALRRGRRPAGRAARPRRRGARRHARRGHEREGGDGLARGRARHGLRGHAHARAHRRRPRAPRAGRPT